MIVLVTCWMKSQRRDYEAFNYRLPQMSKPRIPDRWRHPLFSTWHNMIQRCHNPSHMSYKGYGARGIGVCLRWREDFWLFVKDMGERPLGHTLDREHNEGPYAPYNCRWADAATQYANRSPEHRKGRKVIMNDQTHSLNTWSKILGVTYKTIKNRYNRYGTVVVPEGQGRWPTNRKECK